MRKHADIDLGSDNSVLSVTKSDRTAVIISAKNGKTTPL